MSVPFQQAAFTVGEVGPPLFGRQDLARTHVGASTLRNMYVRYTGGASSRAGTEFVGFSKQTGRAWPPRLIPFQFNINQGLALEFGNEYMRVIQNGAFVTEEPVPILGISQTDPAVVTTAATTGGISATANNGAVTTSYAPGDNVVLAGGTYTRPAIVNVDTTLLLSVSINDPGTGYDIADTITLTGGTQLSAPVVTVATTKVVGTPTISNGGAGGTPGAVVLTGTTGTGTPFQALGTISGGGVLISIQSLSVAGSYTVNPGTPEPVTGGALVGAELNIVLGVDTVTLTTPGEFTVNPPSGAFGQSSTSGSGTGATFRNGLFGPDAVSFSTAGSYSSFPANPVAQESTTGTGSGVTFTVVSGAVSPFDNNDWVAIAGVVGMLPVNGQTYVVGNVTTTTFELFDVYGNPIDATGFPAYISGGTAAEIYTLDTPWAEEDLAFLKYTQSKDVMSICCVNQETLVEYPTIDLARVANNQWVLDPVTMEASVEAPATASGSASSGGTVNYQYVVTAVSPDDGSESVASPVANISNAVNIAGTAGSITITWSPVVDVNQYNVYKASPVFSGTVPVGALFGFAGSAYGVQFVDSNIVADFSQVPPKHKNPFARGQVIGGSVVTGGSGYSTITLTINTTTGAGASLSGILVGGALSAILVVDSGEGYADTDTVTVSGDGTGATATLRFGPATGTYPSTVSYLQQRRIYANTLNRPDTYFMSQPGAFTNFDSRLPTIDSDAIIGNPWSVQVNGIQWIVNMPGGGVVFTGADVWQLTGNGGSSFTPQLITPSTQQAQPQAYNGAHTHVPPVKIEDSILYVQSKGSIVRSLGYNYINNIYSGVDLTLNSPQLFTAYELQQWAWCEEPYKVLWTIRNDGIMLSLTFVKAQEVAGWARHDTQGLFVSCCAVTELPIDALYVATQRFPGTNTAYMVERMNNRVWDTVEDAWCVDAGLTLSQPTPDATLRASSRTGLGSITGFTDLVGGEGYSAATVIRIIDENVLNDGGGPGAGATATPVIVGGVITSITIDTVGSGYLYPKFVIEDPEGAGSGASADPILNNEATFEATGGVFSLSNVGDIIRMGAGIAQITAYVSPTEVTANILSPIVDLLPNTSDPLPAASGEWTLSTPVSSISGLNYLAGATVTGTYDGKVLPPVVVPDTGIIDLPETATQVTVGLGFAAQLQTLYVDPPGVTWQARRKKGAAVTARVDASGRFRIGANQPDGSTQSPVQVAPEWQGLVDAPTHAVAPYNSSTTPLWTGDVRIPVPGGFNVKGQAAIEQSDPLPLNLLSCVTELVEGDEPEVQASKKRRGNSDRMGGDE